MKKLLSLLLALAMVLTMNALPVFADGEPDPDAWVTVSCNNIWQDGEGRYCEEEQVKTDIDESVGTTLNLLFYYGEVEDVPDLGLHTDREHNQINVKDLIILDPADEDYISVEKGTACGRDVWQVSFLEATENCIEVRVVSDDLPAEIDTDADVLRFYVHEPNHGFSRNSADHTTASGYYLYEGSPMEFGTAGYGIQDFYLFVDDYWKDGRSLPSDILTADASAHEGIEFRYGVGGFDRVCQDAISAETLTIAGKTVVHFSLDTSQLYGEYGNDGHFWANYPVQWTDGEGETHFDEWGADFPLHDCGKDTTPRLIFDWAWWDNDHIQRNDNADVVIDTSIGTISGLFYYCTWKDFCDGNATPLSPATLEFEGAGAESWSSYREEDKPGLWFLKFDALGSGTLKYYVINDGFKTMHVNISLPYRGLVWNCEDGLTVEENIIFGEAEYNSAGDKDLVLYFMADSDWEYIPQGHAYAVIKETDNYFAYESETVFDVEYISLGEKSIADNQTVSNYAVKFTLPAEAYTESFCGNFFAEFFVPARNGNGESYEWRNSVYFRDQAERPWVVRDFWSGRQAFGVFDLPVGNSMNKVWLYYGTYDDAVAESSRENRCVFNDNGIVSSAPRIVRAGSDYEQEDDIFYLSFDACGDAQLSFFCGSDTYTIPVHVDVSDEGFSSTKNLDAASAIGSVFTCSSSCKTFYYVNCTDWSYIPDNALTVKDENGNLLYSAWGHAGNWDAPDKLVSAKLVKNGTKQVWDKEKEDWKTVNNNVIQFTVDTKKLAGTAEMQFNIPTINGNGDMDLFGSWITIQDDIAKLYCKEVWTEWEDDEVTVCFSDSCRALIGCDYPGTRDLVFYYGTQAQVEAGTAEMLQLASVKSKNERVAYTQNAADVFSEEEYEMIAETGADLSCFLRVNAAGIGSTVLTLKTTAGKSYTIGVDTYLSTETFTTEPYISEDTVLPQWYYTYIPSSDEERVFYFVIDSSDRFIPEFDLENPEDFSIYLSDDEEYMAYLDWACDIELVEMDTPFYYVYEDGDDSFEESFSRYAIRFTLNPDFGAEEFNELWIGFDFPVVCAYNDFARESRGANISIGPHELYYWVRNLQERIFDSVVRSKDGKDVPEGTFWMKTSLYDSLKKAYDAAVTACDGGSEARLDAALAALKKVADKIQWSDIKEGTAIPADHLIFTDDTDVYTIDEEDPPFDIIWHPMGVKEKYTIPVAAVREDDKTPTEVIQWEICDDDWCYEVYGDRFNPDAITFKNGVVTGKSVGIAVVMARLANGEQRQITLNVQSYPSKIALSEKSLTLSAGDEPFDLRVCVTPANATYALDVEDFIYNEEVFLIEQDEEDDQIFHITLLTTDGAKSKETITFKEANSGKTAKLSVTVGSYATVINTTAKFEEEIPLIVGKNVTLKATPAVYGSNIKPTNAKNLVWYLVDENDEALEEQEGIDLTQKGKVTVTASGTYYIKAAALASDGETETASRIFTIVAQDQLKSLKLKPNKAALETGESLDLTECIIATFAYKYTDPETTGIEYSFSVDNKEVACIDEDGLITAMGAGKAKITVTASCGDYVKTASFTLTVK